MNNNERYLIRLLSSHINNYDTPPRFDFINFKDVYELSKIHSVTPLCSTEIKKLDNMYQPNEPIKSNFEKAYITACEDNEKCAIRFAKVLKELTFSNVEHFILNSFVISALYPHPEIINDNDTTIIIKESNASTVFDILEECGFEKKYSELKETIFVSSNQNIRIRYEIPTINVQSKILFSEVFENISTQNALTYSFKPSYALLYCVTVLMMNLKKGTATLKMLTDIDIILRKYKIDFEEYFELAENIKITASSAIIFSLSKKWFNSPIKASFDFEDEKKLYEMLWAGIVNQKPFGTFEKQQTTLKNDAKNGKKSLFLKIFTMSNVKREKEPQNDSSELLDNMLNELYME